MDEINLLKIRCLIPAPDWKVFRMTTVYGEKPLQFSVTELPVIGWGVHNINKREEDEIELYCYNDDGDGPGLVSSVHDELIDSWDASIVILWKQEKPTEEELEGMREELTAKMQDWEKARLKKAK